VPLEVGRKSLGVQALQACYQSPPCPTAGGARMRAGADLVKPEAGPFHTAHAWERVWGSVIGFRDVESPHFVLQRCALQPETFRSRSRTGDSSRRRF
jgi:hypothetical protein